MPSPNPQDLGFWFGSSGILHTIGTGVISVFVGPQAGQAIGGIVGAAQDAGIQAKEGPRAEGGPRAKDAASAAPRVYRLSDGKLWQGLPSQAPAGAILQTEPR